MLTPQNLSFLAAARSAAGILPLSIRLRTAPSILVSLALSLTLDREAVDYLGIGISYFSAAVGAHTSKAFNRIVAKQE